MSPYLTLPSLFRFAPDMRSFALVLLEVILSSDCNGQDEIEHNEIEQEEQVEDKVSVLLFYSCS